jgi:hypothetical protein
MGELGEIDFTSEGELLIIKATAPALTVNDTKKDAFVFSTEFESVIRQCVSHAEPVSRHVFSVPPL